MAYKRQLPAVLLAAAFIATGAVSAAVGYGIGSGSNMTSNYPAFSQLVSKPDKPPAAKDKSAVERYKRAVKDYTDAAEQYLLNAQSDINAIVREAEQAQLETNAIIDEHNSFVRRK